MATLLTAVLNPVFKLFPAWRPLNDDKTPVKEYDDFSPSQSKIQYTLTVETKEKDYSAYVYKDDGSSPEFTLFYVIPAFEENVIMRLPASLREDGPVLFKLFPMALRGAAASAWKRIVSENFADVEFHTYDNWKKCVTLYIEDRAHCKFLGDSIVRSIRSSRKPRKMSPKDYIERLESLLTYYDSPFVRANLLKPDSKEFCEQIFLGMPRNYQDKYAENHQEVEDNPSDLKNFFASLHNKEGTNHNKAASDAQSKTRKTAQDGGHRPKKSRKGQSFPSRNRRDDRDNRDHSPRRYRHRDDRNHHRDHRRDDRRGYHSNRGGHKVTNSSGDRDRKPPAKREADRGRHHAHAMDERSPSRSRSRSRSPSSRRSSSSRRSRSHSRGRSVSSSVDSRESGEHYFADGGRDTSRVPSRMDYSDDEHSRRRSRDVHKSKINELGFATFEAPNKRR